MGEPEREAKMGEPEREAKMGEPEREAQMGEPEKEGKMEEGEEVPEKDHFAWAQFSHDAQFLDLASFSPRGLLTPTGFPDLGAICQSPMFADQLRFLQSWSPRVAEAEAGPSGSAPIQSLDLSRVSQSDRAVSTSATTSCDSEGLCSSSDEKSESSDERGRRRKRKPVERSENVDDASGADEIEQSKDKARKPSRAKQQKVKRLREPRYAIKTRTDIDIMEDGYKWRKYGQKPVKNSPHPRNYYRCTAPNCPVRKRVERSMEDAGLVVTSYEGTHTHPKVNQAKRTASTGFAPVEAAESLSESLTQQAASSTSFPGWPSRPGAAPSVNDTVGLMMAYQIVRLQWELQAKIQQFMNYNAQVAKSPPFRLPDLTELMTRGVGGGEISDLEELLRLPKVPEALSSGSGSLLARRAAQRSGSPLNPNVQSNAVKMQQLLAQAVAGLQQAGLEQQERSGEGRSHQGP